MRAGAERTSQKELRFCRWLYWPRPTVRSRPSCGSLFLWKKVKSRRGYECGERNGIWTNNLAESRWKVEVGACCRQEGGVGSCSLELSQRLVAQGAEHKVSGGHGWVLAGSSSYGGRRTFCNALSDQRFHRKHSASLAVLATLLSPKCKLGFLQPEREWQLWVLQTA